MDKHDVRVLRLGLDHREPAVVDVTIRLHGWKAEEVDHLADALKHSTILAGEVADSLRARLEFALR